MKALAKKLLPKLTLNGLRVLRDFGLLQTAQKLSFDVSALATNIDTQKIFADPVITADWERDSREIAGIFPLDNRAGGINPGDRRALYALIRGLKPQSVLEVGTHIGASSLHITMALKANGEGTLTTVDIINVNDNSAPWQKAGLSQSPRAAMEKMCCDNHVEFIASPALSYLKNTNQKFDFIFLDGDHASASVYREISLALSRLNPGGVILLHDYYPHGRALFTDGNIIPGPYLAVKRIMQENVPVTVQPLGNLPWPTKQGASTTTLALLLKKD